MPVAVRRRSRARSTAQMPAGGMAGAHAVRRPLQDAGDALRREIGLGQGDADVADLAIVADAVSGEFEPPHALEDPQLALPLGPRPRVPAHPTCNTPSQPGKPAVPA